MHDDGLLPAALRIKEGLPMYLRSFETITMSLRWREGEISHEIVLKLLSHDFGDVYRKRNKLSVHRTKVSKTTSILAMESHLAWAGALWLKQPGRR